MSGVVLVTGPDSAGASSIIGELRGRIRGHDFTERCDPYSGVPPAAVVFVVSAVAPVTSSDCALADLVTARTDVVIAVVSKVDDHRNWRAVLALNRDGLAEYAERFRSVPWVGAAAAPRLGEPIIGELVELLARRLDDPESARRNDLRASEFRLRTELAGLDAAVADRQAQLDALRERREELSRQQLLLAAESGIAVRSRIQRARVALTFSARNRCATARTELAEEVVGAGRRQFVDVEESVLRRCREIVAAADDEIAARISEVAADLGLAEPPRPEPERIARFTDPPVRTGRLETQLMAVLGAGFGLGVALLVSRLFAGLAPRATLAGLVAGGAVGLAITAWVVRSRGLLQHRAVLDRWLNDVIGTVRGVVEERVVTRMLAAEAALSPAYVVSVAARRRAAGQRISAVDAELAELARGSARARAARDSAAPSLLSALQAVHDALAEQNPGVSSIGPSPGVPREMHPR